MLNLSTRAQTREVMLAEVQAYLESLPDYVRWKDFFEASTGRTIIEILIGISELLMYKLEVRSLDSYLPTAISQSATYLLAQMVGYNPNRKYHSSGTVAFRFRTPTGTSFSIPEGYAFDQDIPLAVSANIEVPRNTTIINVPVIQGAWVNLTFSGSQILGKDWEVLRIEETNFQVDQTHLYVEHDDVLLEVVDKIEMVGPNSVIARTDYRGGVLLLFGDGTFGVKLNTNSVVNVRYLRTLGLSGIVYSGFQLGPHLIGNGIADVIVSSNVQGGSNEDSIQKVKSLASKFFQTQGRAVTQYDYEAVVMSFPGVISAKVKRIDDACCTICVSALKQKVLVNKENYEWSDVEISELMLYLEEYKMLSTKIEFWQPQPIPINLHVRIVVSPSFGIQNITESVRSFIIDNYCYKLAASFYPTAVLDAIADSFTGILRVYFTDDDLTDGSSPYTDISIECLEYFEPGDITVVLSTDYSQGL